MRAALCTDAWHWSLSYSTSRSPLPAAWRAATMAFRVAAEPPLVNRPPAVPGMPSHSRNQSSTTSSTWLGPADSSHVPWKMLKPPVSMWAR